MRVIQLTSEQIKRIRILLGLDKEETPESNEPNEEPEEEPEEE